MKELAIGPLKLKNRYLMAPMAGITDIAFRKIVTNMGASLVFTEMISAKGLYYQDSHTKDLTVVDPEEGLVGMQLFGNDPEIIKQVILENINPRKDICLIDFNLGCPAPKIVKNREGSYLMREPKLVKVILETMVTASDKPVSVKFRLGWDHTCLNYLEIGEIAEACGVSMLTLHGRTRQMFYSGKADWQAIAKLKSRVSIPVIGNGDLFTEQDVENIFRQTGCDGVSLARGTLGNPFLFQHCLEKELGLSVREPTLDAVIAMIDKHYGLLIAQKETETAVKEMRKHIAWYLKGYSGSNQIKNQINTMTNLEKIRQLLHEYQLEMKRRKQQWQ